MESTAHSLPSLSLSLTNKSNSFFISKYKYSQNVWYNFIFQVTLPNYLTRIGLVMSCLGPELHVDTIILFWPGQNHFFLHKCLLNSKIMPLQLSDVCLYIVNSFLHIVLSNVLLYVLCVFVRDTPGKNISCSKFAKLSCATGTVS